MGILSAFLVKYCMFMREVASLKSQWDDQLPPALQSRWRDLLTEIVNMETVYIPRCVRPTDASGPPSLVVYWDGSVSAYAASVYMRYPVTTTVPGPWSTGLNSQSGWKSALLTSRARLAPHQGITPPRSEMNSLVLAC